MNLKTTPRLTFPNPRYSPSLGKKKEKKEGHLHIHTIFFRVSLLF